MKSFSIDELPPGTRAQTSHLRVLSTFLVCLTVVGQAQALSDSDRAATKPATVALAIRTSSKAGFHCGAITLSVDTWNAMRKTSRHADVSAEVLAFTTPCILPYSGNMKPSSLFKSHRTTIQAISEAKFAAGDILAVFPVSFLCTPPPALRRPLQRGLSFGLRTVSRLLWRPTGTVF